MKPIEIAIISFMGFLLLYGLVCLILVFVIWFKMGKLFVKLKRKNILDKVFIFKNLKKNLTSIRGFLFQPFLFITAFSKKKFDLDFEEEWGYNKIKDKGIKEYMDSLKKIMRFYYMLLAIFFIFIIISVSISLIISFFKNG